MLLAIDPGNVESGYVVLNDDLSILQKGKISNEKLIDIIGVQAQIQKYVAIEMIASYGMSVGQTVFDTCVWIGRFTERAIHVGAVVNYIYRKDEKMNLCHTMKAKDTNIRQALIDRFGVVGKKASPGWFYGVSKDMWSAVAVGVTFYDLYLKKVRSLNL